MKAPKFSIKSFLFELLIVFIGVYGAFELNNYQQNKREKKIEYNYLTSFMSELNNLRAQTVRTRKSIKTQVDTLEAAWARGETPDLETPNLYFYSALLITQIGLSDDLFVQLNAGLAVSLSGGYDFVQQLNVRVKDFNDLCNARLIADPKPQFYTRQGQLRPEYNWYLEGLKSLDEGLNTLIQIIDTGAKPGTQQLLEELE